MNRFLLDSHVLLWWAENPELLSMESRHALADGRHLVFVSVATIWELGIKEASGKIKLPEDIRTMIKANRFDVLSITADHALAAASLPPHHRDPFDRMLVAQAKIDGFTLITRDDMLTKYDIPVLAA